jgi:hypothetical protein
MEAVQIRTNFFWVPGPNELGFIPFSVTFMDGALVGAKLLRPNLLLVSNFKDISPAPFPEKCSL